MANGSVDKQKIERNIHESAENVPDPRDLSSENNNLMILKKHF